MKLNDKQRKIIVVIMYLLIIVFLCYSTYNEFPYVFIALIGIVGLFICQKIYPDEKIINNFNTESEIHSLKEWNMDIFLEKIKKQYTLYYEEINRDTINVTIKKYLKVSGVNAFTKNKILIVIETPKVTLETIELIEKLKSEYKDNISKLDYFNRYLTYRFDILIITEYFDESLLQYINSEILSTIMVRGNMCIKCFSIPIVISQEDKKLYIAGFKNDSYSEVIAFSEFRRKIRKKLKKKKII